MTELQSILKNLEEIEKTGKKAILATVVDLEGSGYRRPGARMLVDENGYSIGTISGGCLEADVLERAKKVLATGEPVVITYDTTQDENSVFGLGMGCRGVIRVLLEPFERNNFLAEVIESAVVKRKKQLAATLISTTGDFSVGARLFYDGNGKFSSKNFPVEAESFAELRGDCRNFYDEKNISLNKTYEVKDSAQAIQKLEFFIEKINPPVSLKLFGAGFDALPLAQFAENLGWHVTIIDHRPAWASRERFPQAAEIIVARAEELSEDFFDGENSVAVVMTHNYDRDLEILPRLLNSNFKYVGALGPKTRAARLLEESGENFSDDQLNRLYAPIGLDIGAKTPEEIALSIVAEISAVLTDREGGFLRRRQGSIYGRSE